MNEPDSKVSFSENVGVPPLLSVIVILLPEFLMYKTLLSSICRRAPVESVFTSATFELLPIESIDPLPSIS